MKNGEKRRVKMGNELEWIKKGKYKKLKAEKRKSQEKESIGMLGMRRMF